MSWIFKKIVKFGSLRTTLSKKGLGVSWGIPGFRIGISSQGQKYFSIGIPGTGLHYLKYFSSNTESKNQATSIPFLGKSNNCKSPEPWWKQKNL